MRINKSKNRVFSYRLGSYDGKIFDRKYSFTSFKEVVYDKSKYKKIK